MTPAEIRMKYALRHAATIVKLQYLSETMTHPYLHPIIIPIRQLAFRLVENTTDGPELTHALQKLVEAKNAFIQHYQMVNNFRFPEPPVVVPEGQNGHS